VRLAIVSDVHGNLPALDAVQADLEGVRPDQVVHGGDLALGGPHPVEVVDRIRELGWPGVLGNTDELLGGASRVLPPSLGFVADAAAMTREMLGAERVAWLTGLPIEWRAEGVALVHATPGDCWAIVPHDAPDEKLREVYGPLGALTAAYCHIHHPYVRLLDRLTVVNSGSLSLALDGDVRASYVIIDGAQIEHRRVAYDLEPVAEDMVRIGYPNADGYAQWLQTGLRPG